MISRTELSLEMYLLILTDINQKYLLEDIKKAELEENTVLRQC